MANFLQKAFALAVGLVLMIAALVFASVVLAVAAAIAIVLGGWLWWRTRHLRRELQRRAAEAPPAGRATIEGEYRRIDER
ncbi:MAG: phosphate regulon sensor protein PhoR [Betaproteobacteria bacterium]